MLPLPAALEVLLLLEPYLPDIDEGQAAPEFILQLLDNMKTPQGNDVYRQVISLTGGNVEQDSINVLADYIEGLSENEIVTLSAYARQLGL